MTFNLKCILLTVLWVLYGFIVWFVCSKNPSKALWFFGILSSVLYLAVISILLFVKGNPKGKP